MDFDSKPHSQPGLLITRADRGPEGEPTSEVLSLVYLQPGRGGEDQWLWLLQCRWLGNLDPFPTGKFVPWMVLCSCLCQHVLHLSMPTSTNSSGRLARVCHLLADSHPEKTKKMVFNKTPGGKGEGGSRDSCMTQRSFCLMAFGFHREGEGFPILASGWRTVHVYLGSGVSGRVL